MRYDLKYRTSRPLARQNGKVLTTGLGPLLGVFTTLKVEKYLLETKEIMGIIKVARTRFPHAEPAYELMKLCLQTQVDMLSALVASTRLDPVPPTMPIPRGDEST